MTTKKGEAASGPWLENLRSGLLEIFESVKEKKNAAGAAALGKLLLEIAGAEASRETPVAPLWQDGNAICPSCAQHLKIETNPLTAEEREEIWRKLKQKLLGPEDPAGKHHAEK
jgi:hypothetical protein